LPSDVFFQAPNAAKPVFGRDSVWDPAVGAYDAPPDLLVGWGSYTPFPWIPLSTAFLLAAFGVSDLRPHQ